MGEPLKLVPTAKAEVDGDIIERLKAALGMAESGELAGLCFIALHLDGGTTTSFSKRIDRLKMVGALQWNLWRMVRQYDEED